MSELNNQDGISNMHGGGSDKLFEKYLGLDSEITDNTLPQTFQ